MQTSLPLLAKSGTIVTTVVTVEIVATVATVAIVVIALLEVTVENEVIVADEDVEDAVVAVEAIAMLVQTGTVQLELLTLRRSTIKDGVATVVIQN